jgi:Ca-activated chloride channel family protein
MHIPISFARPMLLWLLFVLPVLIVLAYRMGKRRRKLLERFGQLEALAGLSSLQPRWRVRARLCLLASVLLLVIGLAGPGWGKGDPGVVAGRDLMIVLDLSKSMLADDMRDPDGAGIKERWQAAREAIRDLIGYLRQRGGHRVGLVVFAAKPWLVCPLTNDYDHFEMRVKEFSPKAPPMEVNPEKDENVPSGTRIGAGVAEGVKWHDPRFPGHQDVLLISDGDDPSPDVDDEIEEGIRAARAAKIPVHVVGLGDPDGEPTTIIWKRSDDQEEIIGPTRLIEAPLKEIARQTRGEYLPAQRDKPALGEFFRTHIEPRPSRELGDDALPQPRDRAVWFLLPALVLLLAAWWIEP